LQIEITKQIDAILTIIKTIIDHQGQNESKCIAVLAMLILQFGQVCQKNSTGIDAGLREGSRVCGPWNEDPNPRLF
jgi:hypothetical protein